jgi:sulfite reductase alpha subunit-like flavoprotein
MSNEEFDGVEEIPRELLILYATETGNSQDCADYIARQCRRIAFRCRVVSMDKYSLVRAQTEYLCMEFNLKDSAAA